MRFIFMLLGVMLSVSAFATIYKWVDKNGVTHYSDQPAPGANVVELQEAQGYTPPPTPVTGSTNPRVPAADTANPYAKIDLWKPENDETFTNTGNTIEARVRLEPDLQDGHAIWLYLDGKRVDGLPGVGDTFQLNDVFRGTHTLTAVVTDQRGKPVIASPTVTFHMHQTSVQSQPQLPRPTPH